MINIVPLSETEIYSAGEFLIKDPYKNIQMSSLLHANFQGSLIIYDNGVIRGILAVDEKNGEQWFYGNRKAFKAIYPELNLENYPIYMDNKNIDIADPKSQMEHKQVLVMRLKIRDYAQNVGDADIINPDEIENYKSTFKIKPDPERTYVIDCNGTVTAGANILSCSIKACAVGCIVYIKGHENDISRIISSIVYKYRTFTENIVAYVPLANELKDEFKKMGFAYNGELTKLYKSVHH
ncbi:hypothetical protein [Ferroplasma sp.]|uniref:hypothetical protein n=1 Tax=Ferroplasma sp. TaxID=2591003 RepID=UPI00307F5ED9